jgi:ankyrin repeat protein
MASQWLFAQDPAPPGGVRLPSVVDFDTAVRAEAYWASVVDAVRAGAVDPPLATQLLLVAAGATPGGVVDPDPECAHSWPNLPALRALIAAGADVNAEVGGHTPLMAACGVARAGAEFLAALLSAGAVLLPGDGTLLATAASPGVVLGLLAAGALPTDTDLAGNHALTSPSASGDLVACRALLDAGADPNCSGGWGDCPLDHATCPEVVVALLQAGADPLAGMDVGGVHALLSCPAARVSAAACAALVDAGCDPRARCGAAAAAAAAAAVCVRACACVCVCACNACVSSWM